MSQWSCKHSNVDCKTTYLHCRLLGTQLKVVDQTRRPTVDTRTGGGGAAYRQACNGKWMTSERERGRGGNSLHPCCYKGWGFEAFSVCFPLGFIYIRRHGVTLHMSSWGLLVLKKISTDVERPPEEVQPDFLSYKDQLAWPTDSGVFKDTPSLLIRKIYTC